MANLAVDTHPVPPILPTDQADEGLISTTDIEGWFDDDWSEIFCVHLDPSMRTCCG